MTDRYADAVRARRAELRAERAALGGAHRAELRTELALARLAVAELVAVAARQLVREVRERVAAADRTGRARLPADVERAVHAIAAAVDDHLTGELAPALCRVAGSRGLTLPPEWPAVPPGRPPVVDPIAPARTPLLVGALEGLTAWRTALLPLAALPLLGLPVLGGPALAPLAIGTAVTALVLAVRHRRVLAERAALLRAAEEAVAAARALLDADVSRRLLELERSVGAELDEAVARRRVGVEAELRELAPVVADA
ncbi:hypothetical protein SAMN05443637_112162 [Pseudonocardia thermophila]|jgi:hypothetical protein|uniref:Uncharacterized protein n=1 Tax=Pseudonocardia thermophila TaxID=1848 RepID=A0A1M6VJ80_PSETH|nr:hypothetical protein [Pseudonocardia thermophila]SHK81563.1 hypothetical protein SAMN05443637_112162 [Pseudonocardia thermophila]